MHCDPVVSTNRNTNSYCVLFSLHRKSCKYTHYVCNYMCLCLCKQHPCKAFMMHLRTCIEMCTILINKKCDRGYTENIKVGKVAQFLCKDTCTQIEMYKMQCDIWQGYFPLAEHCRNSDRQLIMQDKQCREKVKAPADRSWRCPLFVSLRVTMPTPLVSTLCHFTCHIAFCIHLLSVW